MDILVFYKWTVAFFMALWVSMASAVQFLLIFMVFDYATGLIAAYVQKDLCSEKGFKGLAKKVSVLLLVWVSHYATQALGLGYDFGAWVAVAFCGNEFISIVENCQRAGVPIPSRMTDALKKAKRMWDGPDRRRENAPLAGVERRRR